MSWGNAGTKIQKSVQKCMRWWECWKQLIRAKEVEWYPRIRLHFVSVLYLLVVHNSSYSSLHEYYYVHGWVGKLCIQKSRIYMLQLAIVIFCLANLLLLLLFLFSWILTEEDDDCQKERYFFSRTMALIASWILYLISTQNSFHQCMK